MLRLVQQGQARRTMELYLVNDNVNNGEVDKVARDEVEKNQTDLSNVTVSLETQ